MYISIVYIFILSINDRSLVTYSFRWSIMKIQPIPTTNVYVYMCVCGGGEDLMRYLVQPLSVGIFL